MGGISIRRGLATAGLVVLTAGASGSTPAGMAAFGALGSAASTVLHVAGLLPPVEHAVTAGLLPPVE